jgi:colicin import membrane protein
MSTQTELAVVPPKENALAVFSATNGLEPWLQQVRAKVDEFQKILPDLKTKKGRDAYASMAHTIAKSKTALDAVGKELSAQQKEVPKRIDAERKRVWDKLEMWQKEVRKPLDDWQAAEDKRIDDHKDALAHLRGLAVFAEPPTAAHVETVIEDMQLVTLDDSWEEFLTEAGQAKDQVLTTLRALLDQRQQYEAEQIELARLRAEAEARAKADHEAAIAKAAADKAQAEAAERADVEKKAAADREQSLIDAAAEAKREADQKAKDAEAEAERQALQLKLQAEQATTAAAQAKAEKLAAEQRAEKDRLEAIERQAQAVEQARLDLIKQQKDAADVIIRQQNAREADKAHKATINRAAMDAFISGGMTEACAKQAVILIATRVIPAVTISY